MQQANSHSGKSKAGNVVFFALCAALVLFSFLLTATTTDRAFKRGDDRLMQYFDSGVYLNTARTILNFDQIASKNDKSNPRLKQLADMLILDGPVFPSVAAKAIAIGKLFDWTELYSLALMMSLLQALLSGLILILSWRATESKTMALTAGLLWSIYPPALIAAQRLGTESICALFLMTVLLCFSVAASCDRTKSVHLIALSYGGIFSAFILLTKPVLMFCVLLPLSLVLVALKGRAAITGLLAFIFSTMIAMAPFWIFTKQVTGETCLLPKRMPVLNAIVSNNLINDGLGCLPTAPVSPAIVSKKSVALVELALFMEDPVAHTDLNIRKIARIFAEPWNDFRRAAILPNASSIRFVHQLLGALALAAIAAALATAISTLQCAMKRNVSESKLPSKSDCLIAIIFLALLGHLIYVAFEGIPRYGFTAVPEFLIAVIWLISKILPLRAHKWELLCLLIPAVSLALLANFARVQTLLQLIGSPTAITIILVAAYIITASTLLYALTRFKGFCHIESRIVKGASLITLLAFTATLTLCSHREALCADLRTAIAGDLKATREIDLAPGQTHDKPAWALLLIDCEKEISQSQITFNGHKIRETPKNIYHFYQKKFDLLAFLEELALDIRVPAEKVRQWRAVPIPIEYLNLSGKNRITVCASAAHPLTIYGDYDETLSGKAPTYEYLSHSRIFVDAASLDWRPRVDFIARTHSQSFLESNRPEFPVAPNFDLTPAPGEQKGRLRMLVAIGYSENEAATTFREEGVASRLSSFNFRELTDQDRKNHVFEMYDHNQVENFKFNTNCYADIPLNAKKEATHAVIEMAGRIIGEEAGRAQAAVRITLSGKENSGTNGERDLYFDSKGQPKAKSVLFPAAAQMIMLNGNEASPISIKAVYPLDIVSGGADHLIIEVMPLPQGKTIRLEDAELSIRQIIWPELGRGRVLVY